MSVFASRAGCSNTARYSSNVAGALVSQWLTASSRRYAQVASASSGSGWPQQQPGGAHRPADGRQRDRPRHRPDLARSSGIAT